MSYYAMRSLSQFVSATWYRFQCYKSLQLTFTVALVHLL